MCGNVEIWKSLAYRWSSHSSDVNGRQKSETSGLDLDSIVVLWCFNSLNEQPESSCECPIFSALCK